MKKILMLGTGGTIASCRTENGLSPQLSPNDVLKYIPDAASVCDIDTLQVCNIDSTNMTPACWKMLVETIRTHYDHYDGFVICHGTDTMAYTAAALSYMIQDSPKPIVITGAQKPINVDNTDARVNLLDSIIYAADEASQNVCLVFDGKVIVGTRAKKDRAKSYNAFSSINFPYLAVIQDRAIIRYIPQTPVRGRVRFYTKMAEDVCVLKLTPGQKPDILEYLFDHYAGIVIESFGVGGIPQSLMDTFYRLMQREEAKRKMIVLTTQVENEGSNMTIYEVGRKVKQDFNLMEAFDMTLEATITKLMWLMGNVEESRRKELFYHTINLDFLFNELSAK